MTAADESREQAVPAASPSPASTAPAPAPSSSPRSAAAALALVVALASGAGAGYVWWEGRQARASAELSAAAVADAVSALKQDLAAQQQQRESALKGLEDALARQQNQGLELNRLLASQAGRIDAIASADRSDWRLAEAEYLLRMANHRLIYSRDVTSARDLLDSADAILAAMDDPVLHAARGAIADARSRLAATRPVDHEGTYLALGAQIARVGELRGVPRLELPPPDLKPVGERPAYEKAWEAVRDALARVLVVQKRREASQPVLDASDEWLARQRLRLLLEQAQAALLAERAGLYQQSLKDAAAAARRDFSHDPASAAVADALLELAARPVSLEAPDISAPVRALEAAVANRHAAPAAATGEVR